MNLSKLKEMVDAAIENAKEFGESPEDIIVSLQINDYANDQTVWSSKEVELLYDNDCQVSGCVLVAELEDYI